MGPCREALERERETGIVAYKRYILVTSDHDDEGQPGIVCETDEEADQILKDHRAMQVMRNHDIDSVVLLLTGPKGFLWDAGAGRVDDPADAILAEDARRKEEESGDS